MANVNGRGLEPSDSVDVRASPARQASPLKPQSVIKCVGLVIADIPGTL